MSTVEFYQIIKRNINIKTWKEKKKTQEIWKHNDAWEINNYLNEQENKNQARSIGV